MSILSTKTDKIFLTKNSNYTISNKIDLIISPDFYWVRVFELPVKNVSQVKNVLPTLFEDLLEENFNFSYSAIKLEDGKYLCFAYNNKEILDHIKKSGISLNFINSVYFAQTELNEFKKFSFEDEKFIYTQDDILVKLPIAIEDDFEDIKTKLESLKFSSNKVDLKLYNNVISSKQIKSLSIILGLFVILNLSIIFMYNSEISNIETKTKNFIAKNSLPNSQIQLNSIVNGYEKNIKIEQDKREILKFLSDNKKLNVESFSIKDKIVEFKFTNKTLLSSIEKFTKKYKAKIDKKIQYIEVRIEL